MICMVNHATGDLQLNILDFFKHSLLHWHACENGKHERKKGKVKKAEETIQSKKRKIEE